MMDHEIPNACGYRRDLEDIEALEYGAQPVDPQAFGDFDIKAIGAPMNLIDFIKKENQARENSCAGNSITTAIEAGMIHQSGGQVNIQLSRQFAYVNGQRYSNIKGDRGANLKGCIDGATNEGVPEERYAPYTGVYYTQFSKEAFDNAKNYKLKTYMKITSVEHLYQGLFDRVGAAYFGMAWGGQFRQPLRGGLVNSFKGGGIYDPHHAVCILDWSEELDEKGYPRARLFNSHGEQYGDRGTSLWSYDALNDAIHADDTVAYFLSDLEFIKPRFDFKKAHWTEVD